jgi:hypothetical protein
VQKQQIKYQLYVLWFNLQTVQVEDGDLESAIQITELVNHLTLTLLFVALGFEMVKKVLKKMQSE